MLWCYDNLVPETPHQPQQMHQDCLVEDTAGLTASHLTCPPNPLVMCKHSLISTRLTWVISKHCHPACQLVLSNELWNQAMKPASYMTTWWGDDDAPILCGGPRVAINFDFNKEMRLTDGHMMNRCAEWEGEKAAT